MTSQHGGPGSREPLRRDQERAWAMVAHIATPIAMVASFGSLGFVVPLLIWIFFRDRSFRVRSASAGAFNFNISMLIAAAVAWICVFTIILIPVGIVLGLAIVVLVAYHHIRGALAANRNEFYHYPFQLPILA